jgi:hypothetical protein
MAFALTLASANEARAETMWERILRRAREALSGPRETVIFVHGWKSYLVSHRFTDCQNQTTCNGYWDSQIDPGAYNTRHVGWDTGEDDWRDFPVNQTIRMFNEHCRADQGKRCSVICHSTGCPITGKVLSEHGYQTLQTANGPDRVVNWNIRRVLTLGSAEGGTELGDYVATNSSSPEELLGAPVSLLGTAFAGWTAWTLQTGLVRGAYDHNETSGVQFFHVAGYDGGSLGTATIIPGQDDGVVPFHSACGYVTAFGATQCSNDYTMTWVGPWYARKWVARTVAQWTNHQRVEYCGRDGCDKTHGQIADTEFQSLIAVDKP